MIKQRRQQRHLDAVADSVRRERKPTGDGGSVGDGDAGGLKVAASSGSSTTDKIASLLEVNAELTARTKRDASTIAELAAQTEGLEAKLQAAMGDYRDQELEIERLKREMRGLRGKRKEE